jgi:hypothetical protein
MFNKTIVYETLKQCMALDSNRGLKPDNQREGQDTLISLVIHDIFGGEILKTHARKNWHFYNRIEGERVDFTDSEAQKPAEKLSFEDIPSTPDETYDYVDQADYTNFLMKFVRTFEETVGLEKSKYKPGYTA